MTSSNGASPWGKWTGRLMDLAPGLPALLTLPDEPDAVETPVGLEKL